MKQWIFWIGLILIIILIIVEICLLSLVVLEEVAKDPPKEQIKTKYTYIPAPDSFDYICVELGKKVPIYYLYGDYGNRNHLTHNEIQERINKSILLFERLEEMYAKEKLEMQERERRNRHEKGNG